MKRSIAARAFTMLFGCLAILVPGHLAGSAVSPTATIAQVAGQPLDRLDSVPGNASQLDPQPVFSDANTDNVVSKLTRGEAICRKLPSEYRADCLAKTLRDAYQAARQPDYRSARKELQSASRALSSLVKQNADPEKPAIRVGNRTYRPVRKSAAKTVNRKAAAIVQETETRLLRSATGDKRKTHYQRIARAVGSTKTLFRS